MDKLGDESAAASAQTDALNSVAAAARGMAKSMERKRTVGSMHKQVGFYIKLGMTEEAKALLAKISKYEEDIVEQDKQEELLAKQKPESPKSAVPTSILLDNEEEAGEVASTFKQECDNPLDSQDEDEQSGSDEDEESSHPSQPSDDSKLVKKPRL